MTPQKRKKLLYNAKFTGPRGDLNPMGLKVPGWVSVQLYPINADKWIIKNPDTGGKLSPHDFPSPDIAMAFLSEIFTKQETDWELLTPDGKPYIIPEEPTPEKP